MPARPDLPTVTSDPARPGAGRVVHHVGQHPPQQHRADGDVRRGPRQQRDVRRMRDLGQLGELGRQLPHVDRAGRAGHVPAQPVAMMSSSRDISSDSSSSRYPASSGRSTSPRTASTR